MGNLDTKRGCAGFFDFAAAPLRMTRLGDSGKRNALDFEAIKMQGIEVRTVETTASITLSAAPCRYYGARRLISQGAPSALRE